MTEDELKLWERSSQGDETARKQLVLIYLPLVDVLAKRIAISAGANWEDLSQDGAIGLIKAVDRFDYRRDTAFRVFAKPYISGAIFDSSDLTRNLARRQYEIYRRVRQVENDLTKTLRRNPTVEEVAQEAGLRVGQILKAIDAMGVAFAGELPDAEEMSASRMTETAAPDIKIILLEALSQLTAREQEIIRLYYWEDQPHDEIARRLGLTASNVTKIRQRAIARLRKKLD
jgi:RNA polymerase sigma factor (sigma-70 family)